MSLEHFLDFCARANLPDHPVMAKVDADLLLT
jgi:hypothetical protein